MKENIKYFETLNDVDGYVVNDIPFTSYIKENGQVIFNNKPNKMIIYQNGKVTVHDMVDTIFETLNDANGYIIETIPFTCYIKENKQFVYCNEPNKKLKLENGKIIIVNIIEFVDLGLPSGILWAKYNYGVNPEQLTSSSDWYGNYYAWGELEEKAGWDEQGTKIPYDWANYNYANGDYNKLTKYCYDAKFGYNGYTDELIQLVPTDDVATVTNSAWRMPTQDDFRELLSYTSNKWEENYNNIDGLNGRVFISKINGNTLFIPAAGHREGSNLNYDGSSCPLWSSSLYLDNPGNAHFLYIISNYIAVSDYSRYYGFGIRPVYQGHTSKSK